MITEIKTKYGVLRGRAEGGVARWLGIPYAAPPVGELRFRRAAECPPFGERDCFAFPDRPVQFLKFSRGSARESEDCLYLNVWRPDDDRKNLPVFVWIYGGGFAFGESGDPGYDGSAYAREGVVFVSMNYRLGPLGCYPFALYAPEAFDTNCTLSDQLAALRWVHENISAFGGDPDNVTVAGESAGGSSVCYLMASPAAAGLFSKAIVQSGIPAFTFSDTTAKLHLDMFLRFMGMERGDITRLRDMPAAAMKKAARLMFTENSVLHPGLGQPGPVFDDLLPSLAVTAAKEGRTRGIKLLIGTNRNEGTLFNMLGWFIRSRAQAERMCRDCGCEDRLAELEALYSHLRGSRRKYSAMATDRLFVKDSVLLADAQSAHSDVWMYRFDYAPPLMRLLGFGAVHSVDIAPALGTFGAKKTNTALAWKGAPERRREEFRRKLMGSWLNFVRTGDPTGCSDCRWDVYDAARRPTLVMDRPDRQEYDPDGRAVAVWSGLDIHS